MNPDKRKEQPLLRQNRRMNGSHLPDRQQPVLDGGELSAGPGPGGVSSKIDFRGIFTEALIFIREYATFNKEFFNMGSQSRGRILLPDPIYVLTR